MIIVYTKYRKREGKPTKPERERNMKTWLVEITKLSNGYYVTRRYGPNVVRKWCADIKKATALKKEWEAL